MLVVAQAMRAHDSCYHGVFLCRDAAARRMYLATFCDCALVDR